MSDNKKVKNAKKVDINLQPIYNLKEWRKNHPNDIYFDSTIEGQFYHFLKENKVEFRMKERIVLFETFKYRGKTINSLVWKPDFILEKNGTKIIIDPKGWATDVFKLKFRMICKYFQNNHSQELPHIWFVNAKYKFPIALNCINRVFTGIDLDGIERCLLFGYTTEKKPKFSKK